MHVAQIIRFEFQLQHVQIHRLWLREIKSALYSGIEDNGIEVGVLLRHILNELGNLIQLGDIEDNGVDFVTTMFLDELVELFLAPANDNSVLTVLNDLFRKRPADSGSRAQDEDLVVFQRHGRVVNS